MQSLQAFILFVAIYLPGLVSGLCLSQEQYNSQCVEPFVRWLSDYKSLCSSNGKVVFECVKEHVDTCSVDNTEVESSYNVTFGEYNYNHGFFCEFQVSDNGCHNIVSCNYIQDYGNQYPATKAFYDFFCRAVVGTYDCILGYQDKCPASVEEKMATVLTIRTDSTDLSSSTVFETVTNKCKALSVEDKQCMESRLNDLEQCGTSPYINIDGGEITCPYMTDSRSCMSGVCGVTVSNLYWDMYIFLECATTVAGCPAMRDFYGTWPVTTTEGTWVSIPCPTYYTGNYSRTCQQGGSWSTTVVNQCVLDSNVLEELKNQAEQLNGTSVEELPDEVDSITKEMSNITKEDEFGQDGDDIETVVDIIDDVVNALTRLNATPKSSTPDQIFEIVNNLLRHGNGVGWEDLDRNGKGESTAADILRTVENFNRYVLETGCNSVGTEVQKTDKENIYVEIGKNSSDITFPGNTSKSKDSFIKIKAAAFQKKGLTSVCFGGAYYPTIGNLLSGNISINSSLSADSRKFKVKSDVLSIQLQGLTGAATQGFDPPVLITLKLNQADGFENPTCAFWDFSKTEWGKHGAWSTEGCILESYNDDIVQCHCDHLTNFAILMSPVDISADHAQVLNIISIVGCSISIVCLILTIVVHWLLWRLVRSDRAIILMNLCIALLLALVIFLAGVSRTESRAACAAIAALIQFFFLVVFFMMLLVGMELVICVVHVFVTKFRVKVLVLVAWFIPLAIVGISLGVTETEGYGNQSFCWLDTSSGLIWAFIGPALFIILVNLVIVIIVLKKLSSTRAMKSKTTKDKVKTGVRSLCVLLPTMGVTWVFGILAVNQNLVVFHYLFAIVNSLQGLFIFLFHCVFNRHIRDAIKHRQARKRSLATFTSDQRKQSKSNSYQTHDATDLSSSGGTHNQSGPRPVLLSTSSMDDSASWDKMARKQYHRNIRQSPRR